MTKYEVLFYERENGERPIEEFLAEQDARMRAKIVGLLYVLEEKGSLLREPYSKHLSDGIFELRCQVGGNHTRVLYFFYCGGKIILTNGFVKKSRKPREKKLKLQK